MQAARRGKVSATGLTYNDNDRRWKISTLYRWGAGPSRALSFTANSQEEAEAIAATFFPRLEMAAAAGKEAFDEDFTSAKAEIKALVRFQGCAESVHRAMH